ncbi:uncharacterized protein LOC130998296 [Salvia miltiorrhiza]|uniref:uncharacterized protein LOC130998296 n=1 Tax=Salvia miltiorrhiza TaxID=226208 RepID=UPI0025AC1AE1|nr:uncharacterized protein LOC130998296 [Salvia miltiorrhiza]
MINTAYNLKFFITPSHIFLKLYEHNDGEEDKYFFFVQRESRCATALLPARDSWALAACIVGGNSRSYPSGLCSTCRFRGFPLLSLWVLEKIEESKQSEKGDTTAAAATVVNEREYRSRDGGDDIIIMGAGVASPSLTLSESPDCVNEIDAQRVFGYALFKD